MKLISWNVNGINSCLKQGLLDFIKKDKADVYCFQEVKVSQDKLHEHLLDIKGYEQYWYFANKRGYSGLLTLSKTKPLSTKQGIGNKDIDREARVFTLEFKKFYLINAYFPHSNRGLTRLDFKLKFNKLFQNFCKRLEKKKPVVIASDFNVSHKEIDLKNPKQNQKNAGFTIQERDWFDSFLKKGYTDTFREFTKSPGHYTYWTFRNNARERNVGWRLDYFVVSKKLKDKVKKSYILSKVKGSDHCPVGIEIKD